MLAWSRSEPFARVQIGHAEAPPEGALAVAVGRAGAVIRGPALAERATLKWTVSGSALGEGASVAGLQLDALMGPAGEHPFHAWTGPAARGGVLAPTAFTSTVTRAAPPRFVLSRGGVKLCELAFSDRRLTLREGTYFLVPNEALPIWGWRALQARQDNGPVARLFRDDRPFDSGYLALALSVT